MNKNIILESDYIICLGAMISNQAPDVKDLLIESIAKNDTEFIYMHPIFDIDLKLYQTQFIKYEVGSEEGVLALLLEFFTKNRSENLEKYLAELDIGYISAESSVGEEEIEEMLEKSSGKKKKIIILGDDIFTHTRVENIAKMIRILDKFTDLEILVLNEENAKLLETSSHNVQDVQELNSFNGTVVYNTLLDEKDKKFVIGSESFSRVAKIANGNKIILNLGNKTITKDFKLDKNLQGTIALYYDELSENEYKYKQVKIQKAEMNE